MIVTAIIGLLTLGMLMVLSASSISSIQIHGNAYNLFIKQLVFVLVGLGLGYLALKVSFERWETLGRYSFIFGLLALCATIIFGREVNGNKNWIPVGPFTIQPSEFAKLALILFCAFQFKKSSKSSVIVSPLLVVGPIAGVFMVLILIGKDLGTALIIAGISFCLLIIAGLRSAYILGITGIGVAGLLGLVLTQPNRMRRFKALLDPFAPEVYKFAGWQPAHSMMGLASGGLFGVGIGASKQKWANLAEAHTDFIFSVIGEEMGMVGTLIILLLYTILLLAIFRTAIKCKDIFQKFAVTGIGFWLIFQIFTNIATNIGIAPVIGVTLPFISYGGSAIVANIVAVSYVLKVALEQGGVSNFSKAHRRIGS
jgi:cell division protein FtsW